MAAGRIRLPSARRHVETPGVTRGSVLALALAAGLTLGAPALAVAEGEAPSAAAVPGEVAVEVKLHDLPVFALRRGRGEQSLEERARAAEKALDEALRSRALDVRIEAAGDVRVIYAGEVPVVQLDGEDAALAGDASLEVHADAVASEIRKVLRSEGRRSDIAQTVLSWSLVVLFGLITIYLMRRVRALGERMQRSLDEHPERLGALRIRTVEVLHAAAWQTLVRGGLGAARVAAQIGLVYVWLLAVASLFETTRALAKQINGFVLAPLELMVARLATSLPVAIVAIVAALALALALRFIKLYFASVARGESTASWMAPDLAGPTSVLLQVALVIAALTFLAPVVTGDPDGALSRGGMLALIALGLSATPLLASVIVGMSVIFLRRVRLDDWVDYGGRSGRIAGLGLVDLRLEQEDGTFVRVPHLLSLVRPTRVIGKKPIVRAELTLEPGASLASARERMRAIASELGEDVSVEVIGLDGNGARLAVTLRSDARGATTGLYLALADGLSTAGLRLGRMPEPPSSAPRRVEGA